MINKYNYNDFFAEGHKRKITNIQVTEKTNIYKEINVINGTLDGIENGNNISYVIQYDYENKSYKITTNYLDDKLLENMVEKGKYIGGKKLEILTDLSRNNITGDIPILNVQNELTKLLALQNLIKNEEWILMTNLQYKYTKTRIINELGVDISSSSLFKQFKAELIAKVNGVVKTRKTNLLLDPNDNIDYEKFVYNLIKEAEISVTEQLIRPGKYTIIFKNNIMNEILKKLPSCLDMKGINNKTSFLEGKLNDKIFSEKLNINEFPTNSDLPGYRLFDDEGTFTYNKEIIKNGKLLTYLCTNQTASENHIKSTGNNYGGISVRNMMIEPGDYSYDELIEKMKNGIIIYDTIESVFNSSSNDDSLSLQAYGLFVQNGEIVSGLKSFIVTTSYFDLLNNIEEIGNDICFNNVMCASPSILVSNIDISI